MMTFLGRTGVFARVLARFLAQKLLSCVEFGSLRGKVNILYMDAGAFGIIESFTRWDQLTQHALSRVKVRAVFIKWVLWAVCHFKLASEDASVGVK